LSAAEVASGKESQAAVTRRRGAEGGREEAKAGSGAWRTSAERAAARSDGSRLLMPGSEASAAAATGEAAARL
jgi:hypothetical protein